ncbi:MAG TPA: hypothetical protein VF463_09135 [Sphingobium sp.]
MNSAERQAVILARVEVERMRAFMSGVDAADQVRLSVPKFSQIVDIMAQLTQILADDEAEAFGDARHWVPLAQFTRVKLEAAHWRDLYSRSQEQQTLDEVFRFDA